jgi:hypothetical protein
LSGRCGRFVRTTRSARSFDITGGGQSQARLAKRMRTSSSYIVRIAGGEMRRQRARAPARGFALRCEHAGMCFLLPLPGVGCD